MMRNQIVALLGVPALSLALVLAVAPTASAATVDGCPSGDLCGYSTATPSPLNLNVTDPIDEADSSIGTPFESGDLTVEDSWVNNTDPVWTSEGNFVLQLNGLVCIYVPDLRDEQAPDTVEDNADTSTKVTAYVAGHTRESVSHPIITLLSKCG